MTDKPDGTRQIPQPGVVIWFKIYCGVMAFPSLLLALGSIAILVVGPEEFEFNDPAAMRIGCSILAVLSAGLTAAFLLPLFRRYQAWRWAYDLLLICLGLVHCCAFPFSIAMLIFWLKPEVKAYYQQWDAG